MRRIIAIIMIVSVTICVGCGTKRPAVDIEGQLLEADRLFLEGNYEEVILTLETVLEVEPATVRGYLRLSDAYIARGEEDKALELLQRGLELTGDEEIAARVRGMTESVSGIVQVAGGEQIALLLDEKGDVYYCGMYIRRIGDLQYYEYALTPKKVEGIKNVRSIGVGWRGYWYHAHSFFAITHDDVLYVWGDSFWDVLTDADYNTPNILMKDVRTAYATDNNIYIVKTNGELLSMGHNEDGQLGDGSDYIEDYYNNYYEFTGYGSFSHVMNNIKKTTAGYGRYYEDDGVYNGKIAFALDNGGALYAWGSFGVNKIDDRIVKICHNKPIKIADGIKDMDCTDDSLYVVTQEGTVQTADMISVGTGEPIWEEVDCGKIPVEMVTCGEGYFCVMNALGEIYTGGANGYGELGVSPEEQEGVFDNLSIKPLGDTRVRKVAASESSSYAIDKNGVLLSWGNNDYGQLGNGRRGTHKNAEEPTFVMENVDRVYSSGGQSYFLTGTGELYIAGSGLWVNQATNGETSEAFYPIKIMEDVIMVEPYDGGVVRKDNSLWLPSEEGYKKEMDDVVYYAAAGFPGDLNRWIIRTDNSLWGWGENHNGELGLGYYNDIGAAESRPVLQPTHIMDDVKSVSIMSYPTDYQNGNACFILGMDGTLYHCGFDVEHSLHGNSDQESPDENALVVTPCAIAKEVEYVFGYRGTRHMIYIDVRGNLYNWGGAPNGLFHNSASSYSRDYSHRSVLRSGVYKAQESILLDRDGKCYVFGDQVMIRLLGLDENKWEEKAKVYGDGQLICDLKLEDVKDVAVSWNGDNASWFAVKTNGELYAWGNNLYGQLGLGDAGSDENIFEVKLPQ